MEPRTGKSYIWPTWITGLVSGDKHCQWAAWVRAHYWTKKRPQEGANTLIAWQAEHGAMVREAAAVLKAEGWNVSVEQQNKFTYVGQSALVGGQMDVVGVRECMPEPDERGIVFDDALGLPDLGPVSEAVIVDCKSGSERDSDVVQLAIYMVLGPRALPILRDRQLRGEIVYKHRTRHVTAADAERLKQPIVDQIRLTAGAISPERTPSYAECKYCDLADCPERFSGEAPAGAEDLGALF